MQGSKKVPGGSPNLHNPNPFRGPLSASVTRALNFADPAPESAGPPAGHAVPAPAPAPFYVLPIAHRFVALRLDHPQRPAMAFFNREAEMAARRAQLAAMVPAAQ
jgi:hypothetical protein